MDTHAAGLRYERLAIHHLERRGFAVVDRNLRFGRNEIDLVVRRGPVVAFVEVKGRSGRGFGDPLVAITAHKRREIERVAAWWVARRYGAILEAGGTSQLPIFRFDAVAVRERPGRPVEVEHVEDAWRPTRRLIPSA